MAPTFSKLRSFGNNYCSPEDDRDEMAMTSSGGQTTFVSCSRGRLPRASSPSEINETDDALYLRIEAPGLTRDDVKVTVEGDVLVIKAGAKVDSPTTCKFEAKLNLSGKPFKTQELQVELSNGMLYVVVPKVKNEGS